MTDDEEMKDYGTVAPQLFDAASIVMIDFVDHTDKANAHDPAGVVTELNDICHIVDRITLLDRVR